MTNSRIKRDLDDRLMDRVQEVKARAEAGEPGSTRERIEAFRDKGYEVLFMLDDIDDIVFAGFEYKGKKLKSVLRGDIQLDKDSKDEEKKKFSKLLKVATWCLLLAAWAAALAPVQLL